MADLLTKVSTHYVKPTFTDVRVGDSVRVYTRIKEGNKTRTQYFEGLVISRRGGIGPSASFKVRRLASGVGVERTWPLHSPLIERIVVQRGAKVRRARLYTMRGLTGKAARLTELPAKTADRQRQHPWPAKYGVALESPPAAASPSQSKHKNEEAQKAETALAPSQPSDKAVTKTSKSSTSAAVAADKPTGQPAQPSDAVKSAASK